MQRGDCMTMIYILTVTQQGAEPTLSYHTSRQGAEEQQRMVHTNHMRKHLQTAYRIKGALRGRGLPTLDALAAGIVVENIQFRIHKAHLRGDGQ
jgi:hypothetical protein